ncbi:MAG: sigma-70 family RNA polymerase sigma factor [Candidatus Limnocylindrales bacterium]
MTFRGELADFGRFYEGAYPGAYRTALAILRDPGLAAEVTQDAFVKAYRERDRFRGDAPVNAWLHRIVVNEALGGIRKRARGPREIDMGAAWGATESPGDVGRVADRLSMLDALDVLAPQARAAVVLRYYHDYDYATIARILGTSPSNVGALLSRSLDRLKTELETVPPGGIAGDRPAEVRDER